ncbi:glycosyltransferase [Vibrio sp. CUB2]|uniref:glycosyltransferase family 2 protein n=1 Tax=Vibrio sp. CUB2 TaxID=2315233 RepID=UPI000769B92B|nr:glycosyltransferase [Vibrio sp. CUB2]
MKQLYIHIGLSKTGSSALQSWLSLNSTRLKEQGIDYADLSPTAKDGKITAGNGVQLYQACNSESWEEVERLIKNVYFNSNDRALISSETLQGLQTESIKEIKRICDSNNIKITVVAFARSVYELLYSNYLQGVKRHGFTFEFGEKQHLNYKDQRQCLECFYNEFGSEFILANYDQHKNSLISFFAEILKVDVTGFKEMKSKINRSLTFDESFLLKEMNILHDGRYSTEISDFLINSDNNKETKVLYNPDIFDAVYANSIDDIEWINSNLLNTTHSDRLTICTNHSHMIARDVKLTEDLISVIYDWAFQRKIQQDRKHFVDFLIKFSSWCESKSLRIAYKVLALAKYYRPEGPYISNRLEKLKKEVFNSLRVGIAVVTYNRVELLKENILALTKHTTSEVNIVVADDGSSDGTLQWCQEAGIACISGINKGVVWNKNRALYYLCELKQSDVIILLEDDCVPSEKDWHVEWALAAYIWGHINYAHARLLKRLADSIEGDGTAVLPYRLKLVTGQCTACSADAIKKVGYLDSRFIGYGHGHVEWTNRFLKHGYNGKPGDISHVYACIDSGLTSKDAPTFKNEAQLESNRKIKQSLSNDISFRLPWQNDKEQRSFLSEIEHAQ